MSDTTVLALFTAGLFVFGLSGGAVFLLLTRAVTWRGWMEALMPGLTLLGWLTPLSGAALIGLYVVAWPAYPWADQPGLGGYLSPLWTGFRLGLLVVLFSVFGLIGALDLLNRRVAAPALIVLTLLLSLFCVDWTISLTEKMKNAEFGMIVMFGWIISTLALLNAAGALVWSAGARSRWGAVLLIGVAFWIYLQLMQYVVIWGSASIVEAEWWLARAEPPWQPFLWSVGVLHAVVPVICLGVPQWRRRRLPLFVAALSVLAGRAVETVLWTLPALPDPGAVAAGLAAVLAPFALALLLMAGLRRREVRLG